MPILMVTRRRLDNNYSIMNIERRAEQPKIGKKENEIKKIPLTKLDLNEFLKEGRTEDGYRYITKDGKEFRFRIKEIFAKDTLKNARIGIYDPDNMMKEVGKIEIKIESKTTAKCFHLGVNGRYTKYFGGDYKGIGSGLLGVAGQYLKSKGIEKLSILIDETGGFYQKIGAVSPRHPEIPSGVKYSLKKEIWKMRLNPYYEISWDDHLKSVEKKVREWAEEHPGELFSPAEFIERYKKLNRDWYERILKTIERVKKEKGEKHVEEIREKLSEWGGLFPTFDLKKTIPEIDIRRVEKPKKPGP